MVGFTLFSRRLSVPYLCHCTHGRVILGKRLFGMRVENRWSTSRAIIVESIGAHDGDASTLANQAKAPRSGSPLFRVLLGLRERLNK